MSFGGLGLSLLDVDSDLCNGNDARRLVAVMFKSVTVGNVGNE